MRDNWQRHRIADLITYSTLCVGDGYRAKLEELGVSGLPFARAGNIDGGFHFESADRFPEENLSRVGNKISQPGDVVFTSKGTVGRFAFVREATPRFVYSPQLCFWRSMRPRTIHPRYLYYWMGGPEFYSQYRAVAGQTDMADYVSLTDQRRMYITLPPFKEQETIAQILGRLDDKIELNRRMNETLESMARAIFKSWFVNFDPVRAKAEGHQPFGMDATTPALLPDSFHDSPLGKIPEGWKVATLNDCLTAFETGSRPKGGITGISEGVPSVGAESIVRIGHFDFTKTKLVPQEFFAKMKRGHVSDGDVLLYKDGGRPGEYEPHVTMVGDGFPFREFCINEHVYRIRTAPALPQGYLYFWLTSDTCMDEMRNRGTGVAVPGLNSTSVRELALLVPCERVLGKFNEIVGPLIKRIFFNCNESKTLAAIRDTLLPKLISGEIRVKNAEKLVEKTA